MYLYYAQISGERFQDHWSSGSETIAASDLNVGRYRQLFEFMMVCDYWRLRSFLYHIFSRFCMFCALLGQDIRWVFTGTLVLWLYSFHHVLYPVWSIRKGGSIVKEYLGKLGARSYSFIYWNTLEKHHLIFTVFSHGWVERVFSWLYLMFVYNEQQFAVIWLWPCRSFWRYNDVSVFQQFAPKTWVLISIWKQSVPAGSYTSLLMEKHYMFWPLSFIYTPCRWRFFVDVSSTQL